MRCASFTFPYVVLPKFSISKSNVCHYRWVIPQHSTTMSHFFEAHVMIHQTTSPTVELSVTFHVVAPAPESPLSINQFACMSATVLCSRKMCLHRLFSAALGYPCATHKLIDNSPLDLRMLMTLDPPRTVDPASHSPRVTVITSSLFTVHKSIARHSRRFWWFQTQHCMPSLFQLLCQRAPLCPRATSLDPSIPKRSRERSFPVGGTSWERTLPLRVVSRVILHQPDVGLPPFTITVPCKWALPATFRVIWERIIGQAADWTRRIASVGTHKSSSFHVVHPSLVRRSFAQLPNALRLAHRLSVSHSPAP